MGRGKVRAISSARLRLDPRVLREAEALARSAGVGVSELVELLLLGLLDAEASQLTPPPSGPGQPRVASRRKAPGRVIVMEDFRRRAVAASTGVTTRRPAAPTSALQPGCCASAPLELVRPARRRPDAPVRRHGRRWTT